MAGADDLDPRVATSSPPQSSPTIAAVMALIATAMGLFAAIPAVIAYNAFSQRLNRLESRLGRFADGLHATFSRELEVEA